MLRLAKHETCLVIAKVMDPDSLVMRCAMRARSTHDTRAEIDWVQFQSALVGIWYELGEGWEGGGGRREISLLT